MTRREFQQIAAIRAEEARILLSNRMYSGAYHLCGYAVECALKACIAKQVRRHDFPDRKLAQDSYTHDFRRLVRVAGLEEDLGHELSSHSGFEGNWAKPIQLSEESRYRQATRKSALDLYEAVTDQEHGVLKWLQQYW